MNRFLTLLFALSLFAGPTFGQTATDSSDPAEYTFRFVADDDMFYVPWNGNGAELERLLACIAQHKAAILDGTVPVKVDGYSDSKNSAAENLAVAKIRSNRVKTEMILRGGLTESCFTTHNHTSDGNFVTVSIVVPVGPTEAELEAQRKAEAERLAAEKRAEAQRKAEEARLAAEKAAAEKAAQEKESVPAEQQDTPTVTPSETEISTDSHLSLRANLLRWATLTPDLGVEWRINPTWAVTVNGSWTSWSWNDKDRRYALWEVAPEVRWHLGEKKAWYVGAMFKVGQFNYKLSDTGRQGDLVGGGITGGYQLRLSKALNLDFNFGLGYLNADYEKYEVIDGVRVRRGNGTKDWWGPINAGVTLVWKIGASRAH